MKNNSLIVIFATLLLQINFVFAVNLNRFNGNPEYIRFKESEMPDYSQLNNILKNYGFNEPYSISLIGTETDNLGMIHYRYCETYNNRPVNGTMWIVHTKDNKIKSMNGVLYAQLPAENPIVYDLKDCYNTALQHLPAKSYHNESAEGELYWASQNNSGIPSQFRLCYRLDIYAAIPTARKYIFVDVTTGKVIAEQNLIKEVNAAGTAVTAYSGTKNITTDYTGTTYRLRETGRGNGIETYNMNKGTIYTSAVDFTDADNYWNNVNVNLDQYATDAHWGTEMTYDYYYTKFGRNSIDNAGFKLLSYVHANLTGMGFSNNVNAFWDGKRMTYGDGSSTYTPLTSIDITAHEITHGLTERTSNLGSGEAGAMNEGFSDCMGIAIRQFAKPEPTINWLIGDEIGIAPFRDLANPNSTGNPDTYKGTNWDFNTQEVHQNSTILSHCFYLVSMGGSGANDFNSNFSITGVGIDKAAAIWYRMNTVYLFPTSGYTDARTYSIQSAVDLYGPCSDELIAVTNAWYAVGVGAAYSIIPVTADFTLNATTSCSAPLNVQFTNTSSGGGNYLWSFGDGSTSTAVHPLHNYVSPGIYSVTLTNNGGSCGSNSITKSNIISIQPPTQPVGADMARCGNGSVTLNAAATGTVNWYDNSTNGNLVGTGESFQTPPLSATTSYFAEATVLPSPVFGGLPDNTTGSGGNFDNTSDRYIIFNCTSPVTLVSVVVYASGSGNRTIQLKNSNGNILQTLTINIPNGQNTVTLNFNIPAGTNMRLSVSGTSNLYRNTTGAVYPMNIGNSVTLIGTNSAAGANYYYYFYNWKIQEPACVSSRTQIKAIINPEATASVNVSTSSVFPVCEGSNISFSANAINGGISPSYQWKINGTQVAGATASSFSSSSFSNLDAVSCEMTSSAACVTGSPASSLPMTIQVSPVPFSSVTANGSTTFCQGSNVKLTNAAAGFNYQWYNRDVAISGATTISYTATSGGRYTCAVSNACGSAISNNITLTRNPRPVAEINLQGTNPLCNGKKDTLSTQYNPNWSYQWTRNNNNINGANNSLYKTRVGGRFRVLVTDKPTGCFKLSPVLRITLADCRDEDIAIDNLNKEISVYPNPFNNFFTIDLNGYNASNIELTDILGRTVIAQGVPDEIFTVHLKENLSSGIYFLKVWNNQDVPVILKVIKTE